MKSIAGLFAGILFTSFGIAAVSQASPIVVTPDPVVVGDFNLTLAPADTGDAVLNWTAIYNGATVLDLAYAFLLGPEFVSGSESCVADCAFAVSPSTSFTIVVQGLVPTVTYQTTNPFSGGGTTPVTYSVTTRNGHAVTTSYTLSVPEPAVSGLLLLGVALAWRRSQR